MKLNVGGVFSGFGGEGSNRSTASVLLYVGAGLALVLALLNFVWLAVEAGKASSHITNAAEMRVISQRIANSALEAANGNTNAFTLLDKSRSDFQKAWDKVKNVEVDDPALQKKLGDTWDKVRASAVQLLNGEDAISDMHEQAESLQKIVPQVQDEYSGAVGVLVDANAPASQVALAQKQNLLAERIGNAVDDILAGGDQAVQAANNFTHDANQFGRVLNGELSGDPAMGIKKITNGDVLDYLSEISSMYNEFIKQSTDDILSSAPQVYLARQSATDIFNLSQELLKQSTALNDLFEKTTGGVLPSVPVGVALAVLSLFLVFLILFRRLRNERSRQQYLEGENQKNQAAILRLLDELGDLADGDLTVQATVTEDFTGAIADSINYSIDQLRSLVQTINNTAVQVASAAQETQSTAMHLAEASEHQAQEIAGASAAVNEMAVSIDQVSANAAESAAVAERAVAIANKGAEVVQATIHGMDTIREQIQETSKRIKRLGESSQEIGDIVSLINDIADQTNILALNAAIQASMAGEAGRGFAVVADEVQRLAERSAAATKQIETLVKTIQTDTNEAVISMEQTTSEVVKGANLAQDAGVALEEIESVSKNLADLIQNISNAARQQAASAGHISNTMNVIQEITSQTSAGTTATARSIGNLAEMAQEMRNSVAGFRLPG
jgi:twitching motility protein PilJ